MIRVIASSITMQYSNCITMAQPIYSLQPFLRLATKLTRKCSDLLLRLYYTKLLIYNCQLTKWANFRLKWPK